MTYRVDRAAFRKDWPFILLVLAGLAAGLIVYPLLPEQVPSHWNIHGEVDRYSSRFWGAFGFPLLNAAIYLGMLYMPLIDPRRENYAKFEDSYRLLRGLLVAFMSVVYLQVILAAFGYGVDVGRITHAGLSLLIIFIGNLLGRIRHNYLVGIRTPWTLADEGVWRKTHQLAARAFVAAGLVGLGSVLLPGPAAFVVLAGALIGAALFGIVYSYWIYPRPISRQAWESSFQEEKENHGTASKLSLYKSQTGGYAMSEPVELPPKLVDFLKGGQTTVLVTADSNGKPHATVMTWVVAKDKHTISVAVDSRGTAFRNLSVNPQVALEVLGDDLVMLVKGSARVTKERLESSPFPSAKVEIHVEDVRDQSPPGVIFRGPSYSFEAGKEHRYETERKVFEELRS